MNYEHFDTDGAVLAALRLSRDEWEVTETILASHRIQMQLTRALEQAEISPLDETLALCIIEKMGDAFDNNADGERATVALGEVLVAAARLAAHHELAIGPILDLARVFTHRGDVLPISAPARLARALRDNSSVLGRSTRERLVGAIAICVAKALDDVEVLHDVRVKPDELLVVYGGEVLAKLAAAAVAEAEQASGQGA